MFGLGWGEMIVIGIVALIAIGPKELPAVLRSIGQWTGKIRRMANEFQSQFQEALREAELSDLKKHADGIASDISNFDPLTDTQKEIEKTFDMPDPLKEAEPGAATPVPAALPEVTALPAIDVPMPELPPPVSEKDFAPAAEAPPEPDQRAGTKA